MIQYSYMVDRTEYMREYRKKNRKRLTEYHRQYVSDPYNKEKQRESWRKYYYGKMSDEQKSKKKAYLKEYYQRKKEEGKKCQ